MKVTWIAILSLLLSCSQVLSGQPYGLRSLRYSVDTLHFYGKRILMQRYTDRDLNLFLGGNDLAGNMARRLKDMQVKLDGMKKDVLANNAINSLAHVQHYLDELSSYDPGFDLTSYMMEYKFYRNYVPVDPTEQKKSVTVGYDLKSDLQRMRDSLNAEDPDEITDFDRKLALYVLDQEDPGRMAWDKIENVERRRRQRAHDSEEAARHDKELQEEQNFAAQRKKNFTKAFGAGVAEKLMARKVWIGMSMDMVDSMFRWPDDVTRTTTREGTTIGWFFKGDGPSNPMRPDHHAWLIFDANTKKLIAIEE